MAKKHKVKKYQSGTSHMYISKYKATDVNPYEEEYYKKLRGEPSGYTESGQEKYDRLGIVSPDQPRPVPTQETYGKRNKRIVVDRHHKQQDGDNNQYVRVYQGGGCSPK